MLELDSAADEFALWMNELPATSVMSVTVKLGTTLMTWTRSDLLGGEVVIRSQYGGVVAVKAAGRWFFCGYTPITTGDSLRHAIADRLDSPAAFIDSDELVQLARYGLAHTTKMKLKGD